MIEKINARIKLIIDGLKDDIDKIYGNQRRDRLQESIGYLSELSRYSVSPGLADQYKGEALACRRALGLSEDSEEVAPIDLVQAIEALKSSIGQPSTSTEIISVGSLCQLRSGASLKDGIHTYHHAICTSLSPFTLVSNNGEMKWNLLPIEDFYSTGLASIETRQRLMIYPLGGMTNA